MKFRFPMLLLGIFFSMSAAMMPADMPDSGQARAFVLREMEPFSYACLECRGPAGEEELRRSAQSFLAELLGQDAVPIGQLFAVLFVDPGRIEGQSKEWEIGVRVSPEAKLKPPLSKKSWTWKNAAVGIHKGKPENFLETLKRLAAWLSEEGYEAEGPVLEKFLKGGPLEPVAGETEIEFWVPCRKADKVVVLKAKENGAGIYSKPAMDSTLLAKAGPGSLLKSTARSGPWFLVQTVGPSGSPLSGYVHSSAVDVVKVGAEPGAVPGKAEPPAVPKPPAQVEPPVETGREEGPKATPATPPAPLSKRQILKPALELSFIFSIANSYRRGLLDEWFSYGDPDLAADQGSPALFGGSATYFIPLTSALALGAGLEIDMGMPRGLWGTEIYWGGRRELALTPFFMAVQTPLRISLGEEMMSLGLRVTPSLYMGWVSGSYTGYSVYWQFVPAPKVGFGFSAGADFMFSNNFGVIASGGFRSLVVGLAFRDPESETGYSSPQTTDGEEVTVDLSGGVFMIGLLVRF